jgi:hypothetical protein
MNSTALSDGRSGAVPEASGREKRPLTDWGAPAYRSASPNWPRAPWRLMLASMTTRQPNINSPRPTNERRPAQAIPSEADKIKARLARIAAIAGKTTREPGDRDDKR